MLVLSMNSKRQRRPNVRLGEIGDVSAAFSQGPPQENRVNLGHKRLKNRVNLGHKRLKNDLINPNRKEHNPVSEFANLDSADLQQNRENNNPNSNSSKPCFEFSSFGELDVNNSKLNFGNINRKCRIMRRGGRNTNNSHNYVFDGAWDSKISPEFSSEGGKEEFDGTGFIDFPSNTTDSGEFQLSENDIKELTLDANQYENSYEFLNEEACCKGDDTYLEFDGKMKMGESDECSSSVGMWLKGMGFEKYVGLFEMHEVDEESLPLLTFEDLKEMGVIAVGPRRKLFTAIQQLKLRVEGG